MGGTAGSIGSPKIQAAERNVAAPIPLPLDKNFPRLPTFWSRCLSYRSRSNSNAWSASIQVEPSRCGNRRKTSGSQRVTIVLLALKDSPDNSHAMSDGFGSRP